MCDFFEMERHIQKTIKIEADIFFQIKSTDISSTNLEPLNLFYQPFVISTVLLNINKFW